MLVQKYYSNILNQLKTIFELKFIERQIVKVIGYCLQSK